MRSFIVCVLMLSVISCATAHKAPSIATAPAVTVTKLQVLNMVPPKPVTAPLGRATVLINIKETWEMMDPSQEENAILSLDWNLRGTDAVLTMDVFPNELFSADTMLDRLLGVLRKREVDSDDAQFHKNGTSVVWTEDGFRHFACARDFPKTNGPFTLVFLGSWNPRHEDVAAADALSVCHGVTYEPASAHP